MACMAPVHSKHLWASVAVICLLKKKRRKKKIWTKKWLLERCRDSQVTFLRELRNDSKDFLNYLRMEEERYVELLNMVAPFITRQDTVMRSAIGPEERLCATLRFLATGRSFTDLQYSARISTSARGALSRSFLVFKENQTFIEP